MATRGRLKSFGFTDGKLMKNQRCVVVERKYCKEIKDKLKRENLLNCNYSVKRLPNDEIAIPVNSSLTSDDIYQVINDDTFRLETLEVDLKDKIRPRDRLIDELKNVIGQSWTEKLENDIPTKWEIHGDLIVFPEQSFQDHRWTCLGDQLWKIIADCLQIKRIARKKSIENNNYRSPQVELILGDNSIVRHVDNGVIYQYDITKCMFSIGNIVEKLRISKMDCTNEIVVDLFAGIGYFTLPFLVHSKASFVHACEWNPHAISALKENLRVNNVEEKCRVYGGDCRQVAPVDVADRVNLGLLPSSEVGWLPACRALRSDKGGILHVHGNVDLPPVDGDSDVNNKRDVWWRWARNCQVVIENIFKSELQKDWKVFILDVNRIKSYGARVDHLVVDLKCVPRDQVMEKCV